MSTPTVYWVDPCDDFTPWTSTPDSTYQGKILSNYDFVNGPASFYIWESSGAEKISRPIQATIPAQQDGSFRYVLGFYMKPLHWQNNSYYGFGTQGWDEVVLKDSSGNIIIGIYFLEGGIILRSFRNEDYRTYNSMNGTATGRLPLNVYTLVEILFTPTGAEVYFNKVKVHSDIIIRTNAPPSSIEVAAYYGGYGTMNDFNIDTIYLQSAPTAPPPPETNPLSITSGGGGTTSPEPGDYNIVTGQVVRIDAITNDAVNYPFDHWLLNGVEYTTNPLIFQMDKPAIVQAIFGAPTPPPDDTEFPWWILALLGVGTGALILGSNKKKK